MNMESEVLTALLEKIDAEGIAWKKGLNNSHVLSTRH
jgi:hypothetical protein